MRGLTILMACLTVVGTFTACYDDLSAGNTTQTENTMAARTIRVDSILPDWNRPLGHPTVATLKFDSTNFNFKESDSSGRDLAVKNQSGNPVPFEIVHWDKIARLGRLYVRIDTNLRNQSRFLLRWKQPIATRSNSDSVWKSISDIQKMAIQSVLVADFDNGSDTTSLPTHPVWETYDANGPVVTTLKYVTDSGGPSGKVLLVDSATLSQGSFVFKTPLVKGRFARSIRSMDSLVFWAKGTKNATMFVAFDHGNAFKAWKLDTLDSVWTRVRIRPVDLIPAYNSNGGNRGWEAVRDSVTDLTFIPKDGTNALSGDIRATNIMLDDIRIYGIDRDDLK